MWLQMEPKGFLQFRLKIDSLRQWCFFKQKSMKGKIKSVTTELKSRAGGVRGGSSGWRRGLVSGKR